MTIKLLAAQGRAPVGAIVTLDAATETALVGAKQATTDLTGGFVWTDPFAAPRAGRAQVLKDRVSGLYYVDDIQDSVSGGGSSPTPVAFTTREIVDADNGKSLICATAQIATVNTGRTAGFGVQAKGLITFSGTATINDVRTTGAANPWCQLIQTAADTYDVVGSKP